MSINKVVYGGKTLIDLTGDTVTADKILKGFTSHGKDGDLLTGTCTYDVDSSDATAAVAEILKGKTSYVRGKKLTGTMPNNGAVAGTITMRLQNHSGVVLLIQPCMLSMAQTIINQHIMVRQLQQTSHLVFLEES